MHGQPENDQNVTKLSPNRNLVPVCGALLGFGLAYNALVAWLERTRRDEGYTSILVIAGSAVTIAATALLNGTQAALNTLACFTASGAPMALGSMWRHAQKRAAHQNRIAKRIETENGQVRTPPPQDRRHQI